MLLAAERLAQHLPAGVTVFRWSESALVAVVDVDANIAEVTRRFARAVSLNLEKNIEAGHRFVLVPITLSFTLKRLSESSSPADIFQELDRFVSAIAELGVFWAVLNEPPPGSLKAARKHE